MSNATLVARIEAELQRFRINKVTAKALSDALLAHGRALEAMPYPLIKEMESIAMDLEIAAEADEDGFISDLASALTRLQTWLSQVARGIEL